MFHRTETASPYRHTRTVGAPARCELPKESTIPLRLQARPSAYRPLLEALPRGDRQRVLTHGEQVRLVLAEVLHRPNERPRRVIVPIDAVIALVASDGDGARLGTALIGDEGMLGLSLVLGVTGVPAQAVVQASGLAWSIDAADFRQEIDSSPPLRQRLNAYCCVVMSELAQAVACTRFHFVEGRLARWLLMTRDRSHSDEFRITQEFLSDMLGVRRAGVTRAASALQARQLIRYSRGRMSVVDVRGLESAACSCYAADRRTAARIMQRSP